MEQMPEFWRTEVWHPLSVHFPIALLIFSSLSFMVSIFLKDSLKGTWHFMFKVLLIVGVVAAWIAIYTGDMAGGEVTRRICDPTILKDHEIQAYTFTILFTVALGVVFLGQLPFLLRFKKVVLWLILILLLAGNFFLIYTGHLGASLVYQQGAGVYQPTEDCLEFQ